MNFKKLISFLLLSTFVCLAFTSMAQVPEAINYQGVLRDSDGDILSNKLVNVKLSILESGASVFVETHNGVSTNEFGLINLKIGTVETASFSTIDWEAGDKDLKVEVDAGSGFEDLGNSELLSVPYALNAKNGSKWSENSVGIHFDDFVGIGTDTPQAQLHIAQPTANAFKPNGIILSRGTQWKLYHSGSNFSFAEDNVRVAFIESSTGNYVQPSDKILKQILSP